MIEINLYGPIRESVGEKTVEVDGGSERTVGALLRSFAAEYPGLEAQLFDDDGLRGSINVLKNGQNVRLLDGETTPVEDGDRLSATVAQEGG